MPLSNKQFEECIKWALNPWVNSQNIYGTKGNKPKKMTLKEGQTCTDLYETACSEERKWGNEMINQKNANLVL